jgi:hypothetical protein
MALEADTGGSVIILQQQSDDLVSGFQWFFWGFLGFEKLENQKPGNSPKKS